MMLVQTFVRNLEIPLTVELLSLLGLLWLLLLRCYVIVPRWESQRRAQLPREIATALAGACKAAESCLAMCEAVAIVKTLPIDNRQTCWLENLIPRNGPNDVELLANRKADSGKALKRCRSLSVEALNLTIDARYALLRGLFQSAEAACRNCHPMPGQKICPALEFLKKISLEV